MPNRASSACTLSVPRTTSVQVRHHGDTRGAFPAPLRLYDQVADVVQPLSGVRPARATVALPGRVIDARGGADDGRPEPPHLVRSPGFAGLRHPIPKFLLAPALPPVSPGVPTESDLGEQ